MPRLLGPLKTSDATDTNNGKGLGKGKGSDKDKDKGFDKGKGKGLDKKNDDRHPLATAYCVSFGAGDPR